MRTEASSSGTSRLAASSREILRRIPVRAITTGHDSAHHRDRRRAGLVLLVELETLFVTLLVKPRGLELDRLRLPFDRGCEITCPGICGCECDEVRRLFPARELAKSPGGLDGLLGVEELDLIIRTQDLVERA